MSQAAQFGLSGTGGVLGVGFGENGSVSVGEGDSEPDGDEEGSGLDTVGNEGIGDVLGETAGEAEGRIIGEGDCDGFAETLGVNGGEIKAGAIGEADKDTNGDGDERHLARDSGVSKIHRLPSQSCDPHCGLNLQ